MEEKRILIICGEASGDLNAASLAKAILELNPGIKISAVGGTALRNIGADIFYDIKGLAVIGFFDALKKLPKFFALQKIILQKIKIALPEAIILVDFSGFNLRLAKKINKSIPVIYYTSPQVWASRQGRLKTIKKYVSKMLVFFKFEQEFYRKHGIDVDFVGHPLLDLVTTSKPASEAVAQKVASDAGLEVVTTIALLPGSRKHEVKNILPIMLEACAQINQKIKKIQFVIAKSPQVDWEIYNREIRERKLDLVISEGGTYDCLNIADFCLVASGTATLETAVMQKPFVIIYKMSLLNYLLYRPQVRVPYIGIVNIVAGKKIVPEFIQFQAAPKKISEGVIKILQNPAQMQRMKSDLSQIKLLLGEKGASLRAAKIILDLLQTRIGGGNRLRCGFGGGLI